MDQAHPVGHPHPASVPTAGPEPAPVVAEGSTAPQPDGEAASVPGSVDDPARLLVEHLEDLACLLDLHGRFVYASPSFASVLGQAPADLPGRSCFDLVHPDDQPVAEQLFDEAHFLHQPRKGDLRFLHRDGQLLVFETSFAFVYGPDGAPRFAVALAREVSERKSAEEQCRLLAAFPRNSPNPVLAFAADGALVYFNEAAQTMARALQKPHPKDILPLNIAAIVRMCLVNEDSGLRLENHLGGRTLSWAFFPSRDKQVVHCYGEEITERMELESKLRQSQKMQSVGQIAAGVAHDFNNLLTIIKGHATLLLDHAPPGSALPKSIQEIALATERAVSLTRQLLMFSRKQLAQRQLMDLNEAIQESRAMVRVLIGESIRLHLDCPPNLPAIYADPGMIQQVLINLTANARDAMPNGGDLRIRSSVAEVSWEYAGRIPEARSGRFVCLSVSDTGCGIDAPTLERIFEPFFTTKEPGKGTGLGLATVYGIAKQHNGWVEASSQPGRGSTFSLFFPAASKALEHETDFFANQVPGGSETILVVEDEAPLRELVLEILQGYGYQTVEANCGARALEIWQKKRDLIDLVLTDVMMPEGVSGRDLAEKILADDASMKIIYTSGYPMDALGREYFQKEGVTFLQKPYHPHALARLVRQCLDSPKAT